jgi:protein phosphatase
MLRIRHAAGTDPGLHHRRNEDRYYAHEGRGLYFVTDGMANEVTPHFILETLPLEVRDQFEGVDDLTGPEPADGLQTLLRRLNDQIRKQRLDLWGSGGAVGATLVLALVRGGHALLAHLGDSRAYLQRAGRLEQLTRDHSLVQNQLDRGELTPAEVVLARTRSGPTRFIGMPGRATADVQLVALQPGDRLLLCSDGLTDMLLDDDIAAVLAKPGELAVTCERLVAAANAAGGHDNITVLLLSAE